MSVKRVVAALAIVLGMGTFGATVAKADAPAKNTAQVLGVIDTDAGGTVAHVRVRYTCEAQDPAQLHIWVSAKETADGQRDDRLTQEGAGFGAVAANWLQSHPDPATTISCDGKSHIQTFTISKVDYGRGQLIRGEAWVQFCLTLELGPNPEDGVLLINETRWVHVQ